MSFGHWLWWWCFHCCLDGDKRLEVKQSPVHRLNLFLMTAQSFVDKDSIVREIWGKGDTVLFIFAGAAAEFGLNKEVDWLYFTGRLPDDPLGRLFSTVEYARTIVFSEDRSALRAIDSINSIHHQVEKKRNARISPGAYRDVLFMLIDYSIRSFEVMERKLSRPEKVEVFKVFNKVGNRMRIPGLPDDFDSWVTMRKEHLTQNLERSHYTDDLYTRYRLHLGWIRYWVLLETQNMIVPVEVRSMLGFKRTSFIRPMIKLYKVGRKLGIDRYLRALILPAGYKKEIESLDLKPER